MKTLLSIRKAAAGLSFALVLVQTAVSHAESGYVAHEWGTFTSVQGSDGVQLDWQAQQLSELPHFVYDWSKAGLLRADVMTKSAIVARQRMETPVIYFYSDQEQSVDVSVRFPQGTITEWFPKASRIGPALGKSATATVRIFSPNDNGSLTALVGSAPESRIDWTGVRVLPAKDDSLAALLPTDKSGSHYFAARATDSGYVRAGAADQADTQHEKFLFYRGVGNFTVPLLVNAKSERQLTLNNMSPERLTHLFVLNVHDQKGSLLQLDRLAPGEKRDARLDSAAVPKDELMKQIGQAMTEALVSEGLYPREAAAMVDTWKDSWFAEDGVRVLYVLPRSWTDARLPLTLTPAPRELVRVMVGRSEVLAPGLETTLINTLKSAQQGDPAARARAAAQLKHLGRFADPALRLARLHGSTDAAAYGFQLLSKPTTDFE
jgi:hypothetical protein